jgi:hypothetical protein
MDQAKIGPGTPAKIQEQLVRLYLRLNGFFVTGFIAHSDIPGSVLTEIDTLAVRHPYNEEPEREVAPDKILDPSTEHIDLAICEVKGNPNADFNAALKRNPEAISKALRWSGLFVPQVVDELAKRLYDELMRNLLSPKGPPTIISPREGVRTRFLMFRPEMERKPAGPWFISQSDLFDYVYRCLCPDQQRPTCSVRYNFGMWGEFDAVVRYFKGRQGQGPGDMHSLYDYWKST